MKINFPKNTTRVLNAPEGWDQSQGECGALPIVDIETTQGNVMVSEWQPNEQELALLNAGCPIVLNVFGTQHPPVAVIVGSK